MVEGTLTIIYIFDQKNYSTNIISILLNIKNNIPKATFMLSFVDRLVPSKNQDLLSLSSIEKEIMTIPKILNLKLSIF